MLLADAVSLHLYLKSYLHLIAMTLVAGKKYPNRKRKLPDSGPSKTAGQDQRKQDITVRTQRGETAEQIADALAAQGCELKKGASTVWRLQTYWGLIPYDAARARGKHSNPRPRKTPAPPRRKVPATPTDPTAFYPTNCAHGPQKRALAPNIDRADDRPINMDPSFDSDPEPLPDMINNDFSSSPDLSSEPVSHTAIMDRIQPDPASGAQTSVNVAAQLMSAELLVDLATSTLAAAGRVKELYVAQQMQRPARGSLSSSSPTDIEIANAKQKVREAAGVMYDLAA